MFTDIGVRPRQRLMLSVLVISVLCVSCVQQAIAAESGSTAVRLQTAAAYTAYDDNPLNRSTRSSEGYVIERGRSSSASGERRSRGNRGKFNRRGMKLSSLFYGFGFGSGYIGLDGTSLMVENSAGDDVNPRGVRLRLGTSIDDVFDFELHVGGGRESQSASSDRFSTTYLGAFVKGHLPLSHRSAVFALAGFSGVGISQRVGLSEFSDSRGGFSYGFGMETNLSNRINLSGDFIRYVGEEGEFAAVSAVNLGIKLYF